MQHRCIVQIVKKSHGSPRFAISTIVKDFWVKRFNTSFHIKSCRSPAFSFNVESNRTYLFSSGTSSKPLQAWTSLYTYWNQLLVVYRDVVTKMLAAVYVVTWLFREQSLYPCKVKPVYPKFHFVFLINWKTKFKILHLDFVFTLIWKTKFK